VWWGSNAGTGRTFVLCSTDSCTMGLICSSRSVSMMAGVQEVEGAGGRQRGQQGQRGRRGFWTACWCLMLTVSLGLPSQARGSWLWSVSLVTCW